MDNYARGSGKKRMRFSASLINTWMECPTKAHFKDILDIPEPQHAKTTFGSCIHDALELYNQEGDLQAAIVRFEETWADPVILDKPEYPDQTHVPDVWPPNMTYDDFRKRGRQDLEQYADDNKWANRKILASEHKFVVPFGDHTLSGIVDVLELNGRGSKKELRVIDYKTAARMPTFEDLRFNIQFTCYIFATEQPEFWDEIPRGDLYFEELQSTPRRGIWYSLWHHKARDVGPRRDEDYMRLHRALLEIEKAVNAGVYVPDITGASCMWCPYTRLCGITIPIADEVEARRAARIKK